MEAELKSLLKQRPVVLSWKSMHARQRRLMRMYQRRCPAMKMPERTWEQMLLAIMSEFDEYMTWMSSGDRIEASFEAVDLYHFALEGYIMAGGKPYEPVVPKCLSPWAIVGWCAEAQKSFSWKTWKRRERPDLKRLRNAFARLQDHALGLFVQASGVLHADAERAFRRYYTLKARENVRRQKCAY